MNAKLWSVIPAILFLGYAGMGAPADPVRHRTIDTRNSVMIVHVAKSGVFSAFGHNHEIAAPVAGGSADLGSRRVELRVHAAALRVRDPGVSEKDRAETQKIMLGPDVLDTERYAEIVFRSSAVEAEGPGSWKVQGDLSLHGQTRPLTFTVKEQDGHYIGAALLKQTDFGIQPVKVAGGAVRVKDELRIQFDIQLSGAEGSEGGK